MARPTTQSQRITALEKEVAEVREKQENLEREIRGWRAQSKETHDMVAGLSSALMQPSPGQDRSLLDRMATVTISLERGTWAGRMAIYAIGVLVSVGAAITAWREMGGGG